MPETLTSGIQFCRFAVHDEPYCVWEWDLQARNLEFLKDLTPEYFEHVAETHFQHLDSEQGKLAAVTIRLAYGHALETLFALLGAAVQAPECVPAWLAKYRLAQLHALVRAISNYEPVMCRLALNELSWDGLADAVLLISLPDPDRQRRIKEAYGRLWSRLAHEFNDQELADEYNSLKHGLRVRPGGFTLRMGREPSPGVRAPPERMRTIGGSRYGATFFKPESLGSARHFRLRRVSRNWQVHNLADALLLISDSIRNVVSFLRVANGVPANTVQFGWPENLDDFDRPWSRTTGVTSVGLDTVVSEGDVIQLTPTQILDAYSVANGERGDA